MSNALVHVHCTLTRFMTVPEPSPVSIEFIGSAFAHERVPEILVCAERPTETSTPRTRSETKRVFILFLLEFGEESTPVTRRVLLKYEQRCGLPGGRARVRLLRIRHNCPCSPAFPPRSTSSRRSA